MKLFIKNYVIINILLYASSSIGSNIGNFFKFDFFEKLYQIEKEETFVNVIVSNYSVVGSLAYGWISTYDKTHCIADSPSECNAAASIRLEHLTNSPKYTFIADPYVQILNGDVIYPIVDDPVLPGGMYAVSISLQNGENVLDRCKAEIIPPMTGNVQYYANASQYGSEEDNLCRVYVTRQELPEGNFVLMQNIPAYSSKWEAFKVDNKNYLLSTLNSPDITDNTKEMKNLFKFDPNLFQFVEDDRIIANECVNEAGDWLRMDRPYSWKYFEVSENKPAIMMANHSSLRRNIKYNCTEDTYWTKSYIFWWDEDEFEHSCLSECMNILTDSPTMVEPYRIGADFYLAVAEQGIAGKSSTSIYQWDGVNFIKVDQPNLVIPHSYHIESFKDNNGETYLIFSLGDAFADTVIYQADHKGQLHLYQGALITPQQILAPEGFVQTSLVFRQKDSNNNEHIYLLLGYSAVGSNTAKPWLYRWEVDPNTGRYLFKPYQELNFAAFKNTGLYVDFSIGENNYIGAAMGKEGAYGFKWNKSLAQLETTNGQLIYKSDKNDFVNSITPILVTDHYEVEHLLIAIAFNGTNNIESPIMRWEYLPND